MPSARRSGPKEISVGHLDHSAIWGCAIRAICFATKAIDRCQSAVRSDLERGPLAVRSARAGCAVQMAVGGLNQPGVGRLSVRAVGLSAEAVESCERTCQRQLEHCSVVAVHAATDCGSVQIAVGRLDKSTEGIAPVGAIALTAEGVHGRWAITRLHLKNHSRSVVGKLLVLRARDNSRQLAAGGSIQIAVGGLDRARYGITAERARLFAAEFADNGKGRRLSRKGDH